MDFNLGELNEINLDTKNNFTSPDIDIDFNFDNEISIDEKPEQNLLFGGGKNLNLDDIDSGNESMNNPDSSSSDNDNDSNTNSDIEDNQNQNSLDVSEEEEKHLNVTRSENYSELFDEIENSEDKVLLGGSESENESIDNIGQFLELERGVIVKLFDDSENYLIVRVKDVYFDEDLENFVRNYQIRLLKDDKIHHELRNIKSTEIESFIPLNEVYANNKDISYMVEGDKEVDLSLEQDTLERMDPIDDDEIVNDVDLDIEVDNEMSNNTNEEGFEFEEILDGDIIIQVEQELEESKILFTENEQEEDIIDELIRRLPERKKQDRAEIKKIVKLVRKFQFLKNKHSESSLNENKDKEEDKINKAKEELQEES